MYKIRLFDYNRDLPDMMELVREFSKEDTLYADCFDELTAVSILQKVSQTDAMSPFVAVDNKDKVIGVFFLAEDCVWFNPAKKLQKEALFYVMKEHRGKGVASLLIDRVTEFADSKGHRLAVPLLTRDRLEAKENLMKRKGFSKEGSYMAYGG